MKTKYYCFLFLIISTFIILKIELAAQKQENQPDYFQMKELYEKILLNGESDKAESNNWVRRWLWNNRHESRQGKGYGFLSGQKLAPMDLPSEAKSDRILSGSSWAPVGPVTIPPTYDSVSCYGMGRINCVAFHPSDPDILWIGTPGGGIWKTNNSGKTWQPVSDNLQSLAVSHIAVDPSNPNNLYAAMGDFDTGGMSDMNAVGVCKSTDGGNSWKLTDLWQAEKFNGSLLRKIIINPLNTSEIIAAGKRGIWKTYDSGVTWKFICDSLVTDLEQNPANPKILYAATGVIANYYGNAGIMKSDDFGETWTLLNTGIPPRDAVSRIDLSISPVDPNYVYAIAVSANPQDYGRYGGLHGIYLSTDGGTSWELRASYETGPNILGAYNGDQNDPRGQGTYDLVILADPVDKNKVYTGGINIWASENAGKDWDIASLWIYCFGPSIHADHHYAAYNSLNKYFYWCHDGGITRTKAILPGSKDWITDWIDRYEENKKPGAPDFKFPTQWENIHDGLAITEFYRMSLSKNNQSVLAGGSQDNSCFIYNKGEWLNYIPNYDGMETMIDHSNTDIFYGVWQGGGLCKTTDGGKTLKKRLADSITSTLGERGLWITPVGMNSVNSDTIYIGYRNLWRSPNGGANWEKVLDFDLTANDSSNNSSLSIILISPVNPDNMCVYKESNWYYSQAMSQWKSNPGELWITKNGGKTWTKSTNGLPIDSLEITSIDYDYNNPEKMWASIYSYLPDVNTYITTDGGETWENISKPLPGGITINSIVHQPFSTTDMLYIGTNKGVFYTDKNMSEWARYGENLPNCIVNELEIENSTRSLYAATYGRGIWQTNLLPDGVEETITTSLSFDLYPNPSNGEFSISLSDAAAFTGRTVYFRVADVAGKTVYSESCVIEGASMKKTFKPDLLNGIYFIQASLEGRIYSGKLIIKK